MADSGNRIERPTPRVAVLPLPGALTPADVAPLCARGTALVAEPGVILLVCDAAGLAAPDAVTVDVLARLQVVAARHGCGLRVRRSTPALRELLTLTGLDAVVDCGAATTPSPPDPST